MGARTDIRLPKDLHRRDRTAVTPQAWIARYLAKLSGVRTERRPQRGWLDDVPLSAPSGRRRKAVLLKFGANLLAVIALPGLSPHAHAQVKFGDRDFGLTVEAYTNATAGAGDVDGSDMQLDGALRLLGLTGLGGAQLGGRVVVEGALGADDELAFGERSLLLIDRWGRLEFGNRQGLPDVLTGYAPNNFTFTSAEFGPASGRSLDPAGGLPTLFIGGPLAERIEDLALLGFATSLFADRSRKLIYVMPKTAGFLGGLSYSTDAGRSDDRWAELLQSGLTHETYWRQHVLRVGGSYAWARGRGVSDLHSLNAGVSATLDDVWLIGVSVTWNGTSGLPHSSVGASSATGIAASVNCNSGPWTVGGYLQWAQAEGDVDRPANQTLQAGELGLSYRTSTRLRFYAAYFAYRYDDEGRTDDDGGVLMLGLRANL